MARQFTNHMEILISAVQFAFRTRHSTGTVLTRIHKNIMQAGTDNGGITFVLLDLSAAFDTNVF